MRTPQIIASTRPGRVGLPVADWFAARARHHGAFELDVVDLAELGLGFVSYGGTAGGTRAMQALKPSLVALKTTPVLEAVNIAFVRRFVDDEERFVPNEVLEQAADAMLDELLTFDTVLRPLRSA